MQPPPEVVASRVGSDPRVASPYRLVNTGLLKMQPPPEVVALARVVADVSAPVCVSPTPGWGLPLH